MPRLAHKIHVHNLIKKHKELLKPEVKNSLITSLSKKHDLNNINSTNKDTKTGKP